MKPAGDAEAARLQAERDAIDRELQGLTDADWGRYVAELRPTLGQTIQKLLADGRDPRGMQSIRRLVYDRLRQGGLKRIAV